MVEFAVFALYLCFSVSVLVIWPILLHPSMPSKRKIIISLAAFFLLVPGGLLLYAWLGVPTMAT